MKENLCSREIRAKKDEFIYGKASTSSEGSSTASKSTSSVSLSDPSCTIPSLPRVEVIRRLRERSRPILLFGETEEESCARLRRIEYEEPDKIEGIRNDFK